MCLIYKLQLFWLSTSLSSVWSWEQRNHLKLPRGIININLKRRSNSTLWIHPKRSTEDRPEVFMTVLQNNGIMTGFSFSYCLNFLYQAHIIFITTENNKKVIWEKKKSKHIQFHYMQCSWLWALFFSSLYTLQTQFFK